MIGELRKGSQGLDEGYVDLYSLVLIELIFSGMVHLWWWSFIDGYEYLCEL